MPTEVAVGGTAQGPASEAGSLAREMARAYRSLVEYYRDQMKLSPADADARAREPTGAERLEHLRRAPDQASWFMLSAEAEHDPEAAIALWRHIRDQADDELSSGHRAARAIEWDGSPWQRAQFLAIRAALRDQWAPAGGIELTLIDQMAHAYTLYLQWLEMLHQRTVNDFRIERLDISQHGAWQPPRVDADHAIDQAAAMVDRWNRLFLRTLRHLRDLRRYAPAIVVQNVGQLNVGQQQVNLATTGKGVSGE